MKATLIRSQEALEINLFNTAQNRAYVDLLINFCESSITRKKQLPYNIHVLIEANTRGKHRE